MKRDAKVGVSELSAKPADKLSACLNHTVRSGPEYQQHRNYSSACGRWYAELTAQQRDTVAVAIDCVAGPHGDAAAGIAATLPAAPKCPL